MFTDFLKTLPYKQLLSGFGEVVKHGLIRDFEAFSRLTKLESLTDIDWEELIYESVLIKKSVIRLQIDKEKHKNKIGNFSNRIFNR